MSRVLILYIPVLHEGYIALFKKYADTVDALFILEGELIREFTFMTKEIRAVDPAVMAKLVACLGMFKEIRLLDKGQAEELGKQDVDIVTANEEIMKKLVSTYFPKAKVQYDTAFLRWDEKSVKSGGDVRYNRISRDPFDREMIARAREEAGKGSDWWRRVGAVLVKDGKVILAAHNEHLPSEHTPYADGDPRDFIQAGTERDLQTAIHAEQRIVGEAARRGLNIDGTGLYVNVFPCNVCAQLVVKAGVKQCFYETGNAYLNVEEIFKAAHAEIIRVE